MKTTEIHRSLVLAFGLLACLSLVACKPSGDGRPSEQPAEPDRTEQAQPSPPVVEEEAIPLQPGDEAGDSQPSGTPALRVQTIDGKPYDLAERRGKWVVVNFWATWCAPCIKEMPELSALDVMREHVEVIGLAYEEMDVEGIRAFLKKHPVAYPIAILDVYDPPKDFETPRGLPMTYLITPEGKVARQFIGPVTASEIEAAIAEAGGPKAAA